MKRIYPIVLAMSLSSLQLYAAVSEPDDDNDGVSNYDDYCPMSPEGQPVWTLEHYRQGRAQRDWVGCAGLNLGDTAQPGYVPPRRPVVPTPPLPPNPPAQSAGYTKVQNMFNDGKLFDFSAYRGWYSGRCWEPRQENAYNQLLWIETKDINGPAFPREKKFGTLLASYSDDADAWDYIDRDSAEGRSARYSIDRNWNNTTLATEVGDAYSIAFDSQRLYLSRHLASNYFVMKKVSRRGDFNYCYFFKRLD